KRSPVACVAPPGRNARIARRRSGRVAGVSSHTDRSADERGGVAAVEVFRAQSDQEREELFEFRYAVYVEELGRFRRTADHERRRLVEPEDACSVLYGARHEGRVVGTARLTFGGDGFSRRQIDGYGLAPFLAEVPAPL